MDEDELDQDHDQDEEQEDEQSQDGQLYMSKDNLNKPSVKQRPHLEIKSKLRHLDDDDDSSAYSDGQSESENENEEENETKMVEEPIKPKKELSQAKKRFLKAFNLIKFCYRWCKWAIQNYNRIIHRFISFSQIDNSEDRTLKILKELDFKNKDEDPKLLTNARIRAEMMNFDLDFFKPTKRLNTILDDDIKKILAIDNKDRSDRDIDYLMFTFKKMTHLKCINDLLPHTLKKFCKIAWLEEYKPRRIIVSQDRRPDCFYIIAHGSLVCTYRPKTERKSHTICFLEKGMTFGDLPLLSDSSHTSSVTTREDVQLITVAKQDFFDIFVNASTSNKTSNTANNKETGSIVAFSASMKQIDTGSSEQINEADEAKDKSSSNNKNSALQENVDFLREIDFLNSWPLNILLDKPKSLRQSRFPRGKIISLDTSVSKYIYIIKSGSFSVWIKVKDCDNNTARTNDNSLFNKSVSVKAPELDTKHNDSYFKTNHFLEDHHTEILGIGEQQRGKTDAEKVRDLESKIKFNQIMKYLANVKQVDAESQQDNVSESKHEKPAPTVSESSPVTKFHSKRNSNFMNSSMRFPKLERRSFMNFSTRISKSKFSNEDMRNDFKLPELVNSSYFESVSKVPNQSKSNIKISRSTKYSTSTNTAYYQTKSLKNKNNFDSSSSIETKNKNSTNRMYYSENKENLDDDSSINLISPISKSDLNNDIEQEKQEKSKYLLVKKLNAGEYFGLADILFNAQPSMQLISNGCECILFPKDLFIENSTSNYLRELRKTEEPYPKLEDIQCSYDSNINWKKFTKDILQRQLLSAKRHKPNIIKINVQPEVRF